MLKDHQGPGGRLLLCAREEEEEEERRGEGQEEARRVAVMAFQGKLRRRELLGSVEW